jgi:Ni/Co efflux regulator RcnB
MRSKKVMKTAIAASVLIAPLVLTAPSTFAQPGKGGPPGHGHQDGPGHSGDRGNHGRADKGKLQDRPGPDGRGPGGYGPPGQIRKGDRLPADYRDREYVIDNWRSYNLPPPRRGHQWVGIGGEYYLVAIPTGVVVQIGIGR